MARYAGSGKWRGVVGRGGGGAVLKGLLETTGPEGVAAEQSPAGVPVLPAAAEVPTAPTAPTASFSNNSGHYAFVAGVASRSAS